MILVPALNLTDELSSYLYFIPSSQTRSIVMNKWIYRVIKSLLKKLPVKLVLPAMLVPIVIATEGNLVSYIALGCLLGITLVVLNK